MGEMTKEDFFKRIEGAPADAKVFFQGLLSHFANEDEAVIHFTRTSGGDMRIGVPAHLSKTGQVANFASLTWQPQRKAILCHIDLRQEDLSALHEKGVEIRDNRRGRLLSELRLFEGDWPYIFEEICDYLDAAYRKKVAQS